MNIMKKIKGKKSRSGFTLIELVVVIIIMGILAAVALPLYGRYVEKSRVAEANTIFDALKTYEFSYYAQNGTFNTVVSGAALPAGLYFSAPTVTSAGAVSLSRNTTGTACDGGTAYTVGWTLGTDGTVTSGPTYGGGWKCS